MGLVFNKIDFFDTFEKITCQMTFKGMIEIMKKIVKMPGLKILITWCQ